MSRTRVVVTGLGATTPARRRRRHHLGRPARRPFRRPHRSTDDWAEQLPVKIAAESRSSPPRCSTGSRPAASTGPRSSPSSRPGRPGRDAGLEPTADDRRERLGVAMASGIGGVETLLANYDVLQGEGPAPGLAARRSRC